MWSRYVRHSDYNDVSTRILWSLHKQVSHIRWRAQPPDRGVQRRWSYSPEHSNLRPAGLLPGRQILVSTQMWSIQVPIWTWWQWKKSLRLSGTEHRTKIMQHTTFLAIHNDNMELHQDDAVKTEGEVYYQKVAKWERATQIQPETQHTQRCLFNDHRGKSRNTNS